MTTWPGATHPADTTVVAKRTRLKPGMEHAYEAAHRHPPAEVTVALLTAGVTQWRIWRSGLDLFHVIDVVDRGRMRRVLTEDPTMVAWGARMRELLEPLPAPESDDFELVWTLD
ncbi:L-rhamnose mutarotase [Microbacterium sp. ZW CA_36]|uniref:L-rhamnose mutarotase n=1 Tax=Microbacterium sp. ZW CA_36 TaxID=3378078 RepID=UPI003852E7B7